jgi:hypothetical protein
MWDCIAEVPFARAYKETDPVPGLPDIPEKRVFLPAMSARNVTRSQSPVVLLQRASKI